MADQKNYVQVIVCIDGETANLAFPITRAEFDSIDAMTMAKETLEAGYGAVACVLKAKWTLPPTVDEVIAEERRQRLQATPTDTAH